MRRLRIHTPLLWLALGFGLLLAIIMRSPEPLTTRAQTGATATPSYPPPATAQRASPTIVTTPTTVLSPTVATVTTVTPAALPTFLPNPTLTPFVPTQAPLPTVAIPTPIPPGAAGPLICAPGSPIIFHGKASPRAGLLLYFAGRAVSGGVADGSGVFNITLNVGRERPGTYIVAVYVRGSWEEIIRTTCTIPAAG